MSEEQEYWIVYGKEQLPFLRYYGHTHFSGDDIMGICKTEELADQLIQISIKRSKYYNIVYNKKKVKLITEKNIFTAKENIENYFREKHKKDLTKSENKVN